MRRATGTIHIYTFKEGLLSAVAHDLRVSLPRFEVSLDGEAVQAEFDLRSLLVEGPVQNGVLQADQYDAAKKAEVAKAMHGEVLHTDKHPKAKYSGIARAIGDGYEVEGRLELAGNAQPLAFAVRNDAGTYRSEFDVQPSRWGIAQYKAMLGAIKLKDRFRVEIALTEA